MSKVLVYLVGEFFADKLVSACQIDAVDSLTYFLQHLAFFRLLVLTTDVCFFV